VITTNWTAFALTVPVELALLKGVQTFLNEPERVLDKHHERRKLAQSNLESNKILPELATLFESVNELIDATGAQTSDAIVGAGYESSLSRLSDAYAVYVRLDRLPRYINRSATALAIALLLLVLALPTLALNVIVDRKERVGPKLVNDPLIPHWAVILAGVVLIVALTLAVVFSTVHYRMRHELARLLEDHG
jgi:hypothetical protein